MSLDQRRRLFFKYEKRIRELSPPEKVRWLPIGLLLRMVAGLLCRRGLACMSNGGSWCAKLQLRVWCV